MEVFKVFATLSLVDMISNPLRKIQGDLRGVDMATAGLGQRMGALAAAMGPVALGAAALLGGFGACVSTAAGFEDQMARVGAISRASASDMQALEAKARELGATTQFTASQVGQAEQYLAMAGFNAQQNIAALPGVLNLAAATATDLGRAADISSDILSAFGLEASQMGRVADTLAATCSSANTNMEMLGDTMKYVAPVARQAGLSLEETSAMAGLLANVGIKGSQAGTTLKAMLNKLSAATPEATKLFNKLGITVQDSAGNLRSPISVLEELSGKLEGMGTAQQIAAMKTIVGEEAIAGFAELINKGGTGALVEYIKKIKESGGVCDEMAAKMNDTLAGSMRGMGSAWESLQITIGKIFMPVIRKSVIGVTALIRAFDKFSQHPVGKFVLRLAAALASAIAGMAAFAAGFWAISKAAGAVMAALGPIKAALLGISGPMAALVGAGALIVAAWKTDFGGLATTITSFAKKAKLVIDGVIAVFQNLTGASSEIRGELATEIKAAGLEKLVASISKQIFRIREFFKGIWDGLNFDGVAAILTPAILKIRELFDSLGNAIGRIFGSEVKSAASEARSLGEVIGSVLTVALNALAACLNGVVSAIDSVVSFFRMICAIFTGDFSTAANEAQNIWNNFVNTLMGFADAFKIGDWVRNAWNGVVEWIGSISLFDSGMKLINTFKDGVISAATGLVDGVKSVFQKIRNLMPFSDAKEGPLSTLTLSGSRLMTTLGEGVNRGAPALLANVKDQFQNVKNELGAALSGQLAPPEVGKPDMPEVTMKVGAELAPMAAPQIPEAEIPAQADPAARGMPPEVPETGGMGGFLGKALDFVGGIANDAAAGLKEKLSGIADLLPSPADALGKLGSMFSGLFKDAAQPDIMPPNPQIPEAPDAPADVQRIVERRENSGQRQEAQQNFTIHIGSITLPNVKDAQDFLSQLKTEMAQKGAALA